MYYIVVDFKASAQHFETMLHPLKVKFSLQEPALSTCKIRFSLFVLFSLAEATAYIQSQ